MQNCVGPRWYNTIISEDRVKNVFETVIKPTLLQKGFTEDTLSDDKRFKLAGLGESVPASKRDKGQSCEASDPDRRCCGGGAVTRRPPSYRRSRNVYQSIASTSSGDLKAGPPGKPGVFIAAMTSNFSACPCIASATSLPESVAIATPWPE